MRTLIDSGWAASEAARAIVAGEVDPATVAPRPAARPPAEPDALGAVHRERLIGRFVAAAEAGSAADTEAALDEMLASGSFESVVDAVLLPAAAALGDAWAAGRLSVGGEHAASQAVERRLAAVFQAAGAPGRVTVVVGLPPGSRHELGALAFAAALRRRGVGVLYLGPDVTVEGWLDAMARTRARAAVIGVVTAEDRAAAALVVARADRAGRPARRGRRRGGSRDGGRVDVGRRARPGPRGRGGRRRRGARRRTTPLISARAAGSSPPASETTRSQRRRRSSGARRVDGIRSNGRDRRSRNRRPPIALGPGVRREPHDRVDPLRGRAQQRVHQPGRSRAATPRDPACRPSRDASPRTRLTRRVRRDHSLARATCARLARA